MKFKLNPYNYGLSDEELLDDLRSVAVRLKKNFVTKDEYDKMGRLCSGTFQKRFGSWCRANELAGLKRIRNHQATADDCIADLKRVAGLLSTDCITTKDYEEHGQFSVPLISRRVGSWEEAITKAGLKLSQLYYKKNTNEELFENLEKLWERLGKQPVSKDFVKPFSLYSYCVYPRRFGTYRKALEAFVASFEKQTDVPKQDTPDTSLAPYDAAPTPPVHKTSRNVSWRLRFLVMRRDSFKCQLCGLSPAMKPGTVLVVDHVVPWASGGETIMNNLQTLCERCNGGKSNLEQGISVG